MDEGDRLASMVLADPLMVGHVWRAGWSLWCINEKFEGPSALLSGLRVREANDIRFDLLLVPDLSDGYQEPCIIER